MVKGWTNVEGDLIVSIDGPSETLSYTAVMADDFEMITASFEGVTAGSNLKIETSAKRAFIDNVEIICEEEAVVEGCLDAPYEQYPGAVYQPRSEEHTSELQSRGHLVCRLLLEKKMQ